MNEIFCSRCPGCHIVLSSGLCHICILRTSRGGAVHVPELDKVWALFDYDGPVREAIHRLKYQKQLSVSKGLSRYARPILKMYVRHGFVIVPIPLILSRYVQRGFNQSEEILKVDGWKYRSDLLYKKNIYDVTQVDRNRKDRWKNMRNIFRVNEHVEIPKRILLFDDVVTSGATLSSAAKVLRRYSVRYVHGLVLAKTLLS